MSTDTATPPCPGADPIKTIEANLRSMTPLEVMPGIFAHHRDLVISSKAYERLDQDKRTTPGPKNPAAIMCLLTAESFAKAVKDHRDSRTQIFADSEKGRICAIFDFIQNAADAFPEAPEKGWGQFKAEISFTESRKLKEWSRTLEWMSQVEFANFIEDHLEDVVTPSGQDLLCIATDLEASSTGSFKGKMNLDNGSIRLAYQDDVETTVEVPRNLTLGIPLFEHGDRYKLGARLRFVISGGSVKFKLLFTNLEDAKEQEFERITQGIEDEIGMEIHRGRVSIPW